MNNNKEELKKIKLTKEQETQIEERKKEIKKLIEMRQRKLPKDLKKVKHLAEFHIDSSTFVQNVLHGRVAIFNKDQAMPLMINGVELSGVTSGLDGRDGYVNNNYNYIELADLPLEVFDSIDIMDDSTNDRILNLTINGHDNTKGTQLRLKGHIKDDTNDNYINEDNEDNLDGSMLINFGGNIGDNASLKLVLFSQKNKCQTNYRTKYTPNYNGLEPRSIVYDELYDYINKKEGYSLTLDVSINDKTDLHVSKFNTKNEDFHDGMLGWSNRVYYNLPVDPSISDALGSEDILPAQIWSSESKEIDVTNMKLKTSFNDVSVKGEIKNSKIHKKLIDSARDLYFYNFNLYDGYYSTGPSLETQQFNNAIWSTDENGFQNAKMYNNLANPIFFNPWFFWYPNAERINENETGKIDEFKLNLSKPLDISLGNLRLDNISLNLRSKNVDFERDEAKIVSMSPQQLLNLLDNIDTSNGWTEDMINSHYTQYATNNIFSCLNNCSTALHFKESNLQEFNTNRFDGDEYPHIFKIPKYNLLRNIDTVPYYDSLTFSGTDALSNEQYYVEPKFHNNISANLLELGIDGSFSDTITYKLGNKFVSLDYEKVGYSVERGNFSNVAQEATKNFSKDILLPSLNLNWKYTDDINLDFNYYRSYNDIDNETMPYMLVPEYTITSTGSSYTDSDGNTYTGSITFNNTYEAQERVNFDLEVYDNIDVTSKLDLEIQGLKVKTEVNAFWKSSDSVDWNKGNEVVTENVSGGTDTDGDGVLDTWTVDRLYSNNNKYQRNKTITGVNALVELPELEVGKISGSVKQIVSYVHTNIDVDNSGSDTDNDDLTSTHKLKAVTLLSMTPNDGKTNIDTTFIYVRPEKYLERDGGDTTTYFDYQPRFMVNLSGDHQLNDQVKVHAKVTGLLNRLDQKNCKQSYKDEGFTQTTLGQDGQPRRLKNEVKHTTTYKAGLTFTV